MPLPNFDLAIYDPAYYPAQLATKVAQFTQNFAEFGVDAPAIFASSPQHYRMRVEFGIWHDGDGLDYTMSAPDNPKQRVRLDTFPPAAEIICATMPRLRERLIGNDSLRRRLFRVDFLATLSGELMISLIYHRKLDADWEAAARGLASELNAQIIGRSRGQKVVLERDWLLESFDFHGRHLKYQQIEGSFTQPNAGVNRQMLGWACQQAAGFGGNLVELYCGNGNFTIALAPLFGQVLATEVSKTSIHSAQYNLAANGIDNIQFARLSAEEFSAALAGRELFQRLKDIDLAAFRQATLFVDPPRAGLDPATVELARSFDRILYISCNQETLRDNVAALHDTHRIAAAAAFDQFPYTHHLECGVVLVRR